MKKFYAGVGSRNTPGDILNVMTTISYNLKDSYILRSGGAAGADKAFESGATDKEIFRPEDATAESIELASHLHPNWGACKDYAKKLHGRNAQIVLGKNLDEPVDFVLCWTPSAKLVGGTAMAIRIAEDNNIPIFNLADHEQYTNFVESYLNKDLL